MTESAERFLQVGILKSNLTAEGAKVKREIRKVERTIFFSERQRVKKVNENNRDFFLKGTNFCNHSPERYVLLPI
jgi:hypothetical protein